MGQRGPAVVGLYLRESGRWRRIAEYRLNADGVVTFRAIDPVEGLVARVWYHQGVDLLDQERTVSPQDGPEFLRALLQPFGFRDYRFRDDSRARDDNPVRDDGAFGDNASHPVPRGNDHATAESGCAACAGDGAAHGSHRTRPAAWRTLDADTVRF
ncbi:hypothetical protein JK358_17095 [Nocardia sp. 2]|uniref:Uncharacterized protein n=1 Tax=Nocardia acididurans TaxID=2802282 RepID=A0ABS1M649_9NOCA|nr:hypothetical protein [Nocardia acididurans]MBL1076117.1 hypothetical protein [Nocardia acididurans]